MATKQATKAGRKAARTAPAANATAASSKTAASPKRGKAGTAGASKAATAAAMSSKIAVSRNRGAPSSKAVPARATPAKPAKPAKTAKTADPATVRTEVLELFRACYPSPDGTDEPDATILAMDPNAFALDPAPFHETLQARFGVGASGGTVAHTIAQIAAAWDGTLRD